MNSVTRIPQQETEPLKVKNRRVAIRHAVRMPLRYRPSGGQIDSAWKGGQMLDMSADGILIEISHAMPVGSTLELTIDWTGLYHGKPMVRLFLIGSVARIDGRGTALRILSHQFRDVRPAVVRPRRAERNLAVA